VTFATRKCPQSYLSIKDECKHLVVCIDALHLALLKLGEMTFVGCSSSEDWFVRHDLPKISDSQVTKAAEALVRFDLE
jgi:hypothetical protein